MMPKYALKTAASAYRDGDLYAVNVILNDGSNDLATRYMVNPGNDKEAIHIQLEAMLKIPQGQPGAIPIIAAPAAPPPPQIANVQLWQLKAALTPAQLTAANAAVAASGAALQVGWSIGNTVSLTGPLVAALIAANVLTAATAASTFTAAAALTL